VTPAAGGLGARDLAAVMAVVFLWGFNFIAVKLGVTQFPPIFASAVRFALVTAMLVPFLKFPKGRLKEVLVLSVVLGGLHFSLLFFGISGSGVAIAAVILQLGVPFSAVFAWVLLGDAFGWRRTVGTIIAFAGIVVMVGAPEQHSSYLHVGLLLGAAAAWGLSNPLVKRLQEVNPFAVTAWMSFFAWPQLIVISLLFEDGQWAAFRTADWMGYGGILYAAIGSSVIAYGLWYYLIGKHGVSRVIAFNLLPPLVAAVLGVMLLDETLTPSMIAGGTLVLLGVAVVQLRWRKAWLARG
jgi:O-acetylserine/cysteine efflux transporter